MTRPFKIHVTIDSIKLTAFEKVILATLKGVCYNYHHMVDGNPMYADRDPSVHIVITKDDSFAWFKVFNCARGVLDDVKETLQPFACGMQFQGNAWTDDNHVQGVTIGLQRFDVVYKPEVVPTYVLTKPKN